MKRSFYFDPELLPHLTDQPLPNSNNADLNAAPLWMTEDDVTPGVRIIELNSSGNPQSPDDEDSWSHVYPEQDGFQANQTARERHRLGNDTNEYPDYSFSFYDNGTQEVQDSTYSPRMNCFTIIDKRFTESSDESEDCARTGTPRDSIVHDWEENEDQSGLYNPDPQPEKRTIWIYSFKNKRLLSDDDCMLVNIPSEEPSSTSGVEELEQPRNERVATPIRPSYVPRLMLPLSPVLPTLAEEASEPKPPSPLYTDQSKDTLQPKSVNNWCREANDSGVSVCDRKKYGSKHVTQWLSLSPRDKKRIFKNVAPVHLFVDTPRSPAMSSNDRARSEVETREQSTETSDCVEANVTQKRKAMVKQLRAVLNGESGSRPETQSASTRSPSASRCRDKATDTGIQQELEDRGDYRRLDEYYHRPQIRFSPKPISKQSMTQPVRNVSRTNWMVENSELTDDGEPRVRGRPRVEYTGENMVIRNTSLLQPTRWAPYLPISGSLPSMRLSLASEATTAASQSWLVRLATCFGCCK